MSEQNRSCMFARFGLFHNILGDVCANLDMLCHIQTGNTSLNLGIGQQAAFQNVSFCTEYSILYYYINWDSGCRLSSLPEGCLRVSPVETWWVSGSMLTKMYAFQIINKIRVQKGWPLRIFLVMISYPCYDRTIALVSLTCSPKLFGRQIFPSQRGNPQ